MMRLEVEVYDLDGEPIQHGCFVQSDPTGGEEVLKKKVKNEDEFKALLGNKQAWVSVPVVETQGGPGYSSIKIGVEIGVHVDQSNYAIKRAADLLVQESLTIVDAHIHNAYDILLAHRDMMDEKNAKAGRE